MARWGLDNHERFYIIGNMETIVDREAKVAAPIEATRAVAALAALAQETRLAIFRLLVEYAPQGLTPGAIAMKLSLAPATLSFHLKELVNAGLVSDHRDGRFIWYRTDVAAMNALLGYLTENCCRASGSSACAPGCAPAPCGPSPTRNRSRQ